MNKNSTIYKLNKYIEKTGSTWYKPSKKDEKYYKEAIKTEMLVEDKGYYTSLYIHEQEENIAKYSIARLHYGDIKKYPESYIDFYISIYESLENIKLDKWQKEAVYMAINNNLFILTGGPGTGKTCTLKCIYFCIRKIFKTDDILFTAPTGKAARRITESVGCPAYTVASALGLHDEESKPQKIYNQCVIVDEISMMDTYTTVSLFMATDIKSKLILVGDVNQLPSVGYGSVLRDLIDAGIPCMKLEKTFRQASDSGIFANIEQIKSGLHLGFVERNDFIVYNAKSSSEAKDIMVNAYAEAVKKFGLDNVVCLTPFRTKGDACAIKMNNVLQSKLNPPTSNTDELKTKVVESNGYTYDISFRKGDPVMQLVNTYKAANGDVGVVKTIDSENGLIIVDFQGTTKIYNSENIDQLALAYAMSVHKSQGSEYAVVITSAIKDDMPILSRNTIYTAVTRAKKKCIVVTDSDTAKKACTKEIGYERVTRLCQKIKHQENKYQLLKTLYQQSY